MDEIVGIIAGYASVEVIKDSAIPCPLTLLATML